LHHNDHFHLEQSFDFIQGEVDINPLGCGIETFWYRVKLSVTDPAGLQVTDSKEIFPDCEGDGVFYGDFSVFPNPTIRNIGLKFGADSGEYARVRVFTIAGKQVYSNKFELGQHVSTLRFVLPELTAGIYVISCQTANWEEKKKLLISPR
jgi:hypothetical protein